MMIVGLWIRVPLYIYLKLRKLRVLKEYNFVNLIMDILTKNPSIRVISQSPPVFFDQSCCTSYFLILQNVKA